MRQAEADGSPCGSRVLPAEVRAGVTPKVRADRPLGEWNSFTIWMRGDRLSVDLNGKSVIIHARLPSVPGEGPIALQNHGDPVEFREVYIRELPPAPIVRGIQRNVVGIAGVCVRGPVDTPVEITSVQRFKDVFGAHAHAVPISSAKSMVGHLTAAAAGLGLLCALGVLREQVAPPTINLEHPDPKLALDYVANEAKPVSAHAAMVNAFAFGGTNSCLVVKEAER